MGKFLTKDEDGFERVVFAEVLIPNVPNVYGDFQTPENVREFAYWYMANIGQWYWDKNHDGEEFDDMEVVVVESFIARPGDPDFIEGSWVLGTWIRNDELWEQVLDGELNGYSWEALVNLFPVEASLPTQQTAYGWTEENLDDGHKHKFYAILDDAGRPLLGGTSFNQHHSHLIRTHTFTEEADGHVHIFNVVRPE